MNSFAKPGVRREVGAVVFLVGLLGAPMQVNASDGADLTRSDAELANLVVQDCGSCHGLTLRGGLGPPLRPEDLGHLPAEAIAAIIREGVPGTAMPPWKPLLSPEEIQWISEQLKSGDLVSP